MSDQSTETEAVSTIVACNISEFRAAVSDSFVPLQVGSAHPERFRGVIRAADIDDVHITHVHATDHEVVRTPDLIARDDRAFFKLSLMLSGSGLLIQDGREAILRPGDLAVYDTSRPYSLEFGQEFRTMVVMFPRQMLSLSSESIGELTAVRISGSEGLGAVVAPFLTQIDAHLEELSGPTGSQLMQSALDLVGTVFTRELGLDNTADPHTRLLQRIRGYIDRNLGSTELTPAHIANAHFISTRHLHGLFQADGTTVSTWIRKRRLERCRRDLIDPALADRPVAAIAARWGFVDAAHFSRAFKAAYGDSPSRVRASAQATAHVGVAPSGTPID
nr:helix-turn-helix domain-containing protein [Microbacterium karelineae]